MNLFHSFFDSVVIFSDVKYTECGKNPSLSYRRQHCRVQQSVFIFSNSKANLWTENEQHILCICLTKYGR